MQGIRRTITTKALLDASHCSETISIGRIAAEMLTPGIRAIGRGNGDKVRGTHRASGISTY